jgi:hypothetical protein
MGDVLRLFAIVYLVLLWGGVGLVLSVGGRSYPDPLLGYGNPTIVLLIAAFVLTLPGAMLYVFGSIANDTRSMRNSLAEMLRLLSNGR